MEYYDRVCFLLAVFTSRCVGKFVISRYASICIQVVQDLVFKHLVTRPFCPLQLQSHLSTSWSVCFQGHLYITLAIGFEW